MKKKPALYYAVAAALLAAYAPTVTAVEEMEYNSPIGTSQRLTIGGDKSVTVDASISSEGDIDYFSFEGKFDDKVTIDIDGGVQVSASGVLSGVDTTIALFGPAPASVGTVTYDKAFHKHAENDDKTVLDDGSAHKADSRIDEFRLTADGVWTVGVTRRNGLFQHGGAFKAGVAPKLSVGTYKLIISGVTPLMQIISIDVKPGNEDPSPVNVKAKGVIPVALLGAADFNVKEVDQASLTFGATGDEKTWRHCQKNVHDFNGDGFPDLLCHFENGVTGFDEQDLMGTVKGKKAGKNFRGHGRLKVKPADRED